LMLQQGSPRIEDLTFEFLKRVHDEQRLANERSGLKVLSRVLEHQGVNTQSLHLSEKNPIAMHPEDTKDPDFVPTDDDLNVEWLDWCTRWFKTSSIPKPTRNSIFAVVRKLGRWLAEVHPEVTSPAHWTRSLAAEVMALISRMNVGDYMSKRSRT